MTTICDKQTDYSRLVVTYDRFGLYIYEWSENTLEDAESAYLLTEGGFSWEDFKNRERCYSRDNGTGTMKARLVAGAISLLSACGGATSQVDSLEEGY